MTSSESPEQCATRVLKGVAELLSDEQIAMRIDEPIDQAVSACMREWRSPMTINKLHRLLGAFLERATRSADEQMDTIAKQAVIDQAVALLDGYYQGRTERGYDGALLDIEYAAVTGTDGCVSTGSPLGEAGHATAANADSQVAVLMQLAEILKTLRREQYIAWVLRRHIDPLDGVLQRAVAAKLLEVYRRSPSSSSLRCEPFEAVPHIAELIKRQLARRRLLLSLGAVCIDDWAATRP